MEEYVELIKAVMMQESGGKGTDPMQASESGYNKKYGRKPGAIKDPNYSIECGIKALKSCLDKASVQDPLDMERIKLALQGYNFGNGYIDWALSKYGGYTPANALEFSKEQAKKLEQIHMVILNMLIMFFAIIHTEIILMTLYITDLEN